MSAGGGSRSAFNVAEDVPTVRRITPSVRANTISYTRAAPPVGAHTPSRRTSPGDGSVNCGSASGCPSPTAHSASGCPSPTAREAHEDAAVALNKHAAAVS